jgi:hypothetical protein
MRVGLANGVHSGRRAKRSAVMSKPKSPPASRAAVSNALLVEVPPRFIACPKPAAPARKPPCAAWPPWSAACATTTTIGWCRWKARPRKLHPGAGQSLRLAILLDPRSPGKPKAAPGNS